MSVCSSAATIAAAMYGVHCRYMATRTTANQQQTAYQRAITEKTELTREPLNVDGLTDSEKTIVSVVRLRSRLKSRMVGLIKSDVTLVALRAAVASLAAMRLLYTSCTAPAANCIREKMSNHGTRIFMKTTQTDSKGKVQ